MNNPSMEVHACNPALSREKRDEKSSLAERQIRGHPVPRETLSYKLEREGTLSSPLLPHGCSNLHTLLLRATTNV